MKSKYYFRCGFDNDFHFKYPQLFNFEFLSFHWEDHSKWITILGFSFIWERSTYAFVRRNK